MPLLIDKGRPWATTAALIALLAVLVYGQLNGVPAQSRDAVGKTTDVCQAVNELKDGFHKFVDAQLDRAAKSLPTIDYYRSHPVELGRQLALLKQQHEDIHVVVAPD